VNDALGIFALIVLCLVAAWAAGKLFELFVGPFHED
jgi:hypothetical protein